MNDPSNDPLNDLLVEVILLSRNDPKTGMGIARSVLAQQ